MKKTGTIAIILLMLSVGGTVAYLNQRVHFEEVAEANGMPNVPVIGIVVDLPRQDESKIEEILARLEGRHIFVGISKRTAPENARLFSKYGGLRFGEENLTLRDMARLLGIFVSQREVVLSQNDFAIIALTQ